MTNSNEAFSRVLIDAQLADQGWSTQADYVLCRRDVCKVRRIFQ